MEIIRKIWKIINEFKDLTVDNNFFNINRKQQENYWMNESLKELILNDIYLNSNYTEIHKTTEKRLDDGEITSFQAAEIIYKKVKSSTQS